MIRVVNGRACPAICIFARAHTRRKRKRFPNAQGNTARFMMFPRMLHRQCPVNRRG
jgi:hypothetical protein